MPNTLITGATGGLGRALAQELQDHQLILQGRNLEALQALCAELPRARPLRLDLAQPECFAAALQDLPPLDNLIHNAGMVELGRVCEQSHEVWTQTLAVNVVAAAELTRLLLPTLREQRGQVVFINSGAGVRASAGWGSYAASKFALRALADALREEESALRVTSVYIGRTATPMQQKVRAQEQASYQPEQYLQPATIALSVRHLLETPADAAPNELTLRPR